MGSRFHCGITAVIDTCSCGKQNAGKIVGGNETATNEYPSMAGLTDGKEGIVCGATISIIDSQCFTQIIIKNFPSILGCSNFRGSLFQW